MLWPEIWAYKQYIGKGMKWFCSWKCLRANEKGAKNEVKGNPMIESAKKLVEAMERGEDPLEFLKAEGYTNPEKAYQNLKYRCKDREPELYKKFPKRREAKTERILGRPREDFEKAEPEPQRKPAVTQEEWAEIRQQIADQEKRHFEEELRKPLEAASLKSRVLSVTYSRTDDGEMCMESPALLMNMIILEPKVWIRLAAEVGVALEQLGLKK